MNYKFGTKANWRRWQWNRIVERLAVPVRDAVVVYLAGPEDLDRPVALSKGFKPDNLIAVDRDGDVVKQLRMNGTLSVCATIEDVVMSFPVDRSADVVIADYCGGLSQSRANMIYRMIHSPNFSKTVWSFNLLRGRDGTFNDGRALMLELSDGNIPKHRGILIVNAVAYQLVHDFVTHNGAPNTELFWERTTRKLFEAMRPAFESYPSEVNGVRMFMDSCVFKSPFSIGAETHEGREIQRRALEMRRVERSDGTRRSISAVLAHRTMRQN
jgi:hypothetical protein